MPKSKNQIFNDEKTPKAYKNPKLSSNKTFPEWFGHETSEPIGFHDNVVIIQRKLIFSKKIPHTGDKASLDRCG